MTWDTYIAPTVRSVCVTIFCRYLYIHYLQILVTETDVPQPVQLMVGKFYRWCGFFLSCASCVRLLYCLKRLNVFTECTLSPGSWMFQVYVCFVCALCDTFHMYLMPTNCQRLLLVQYLQVRSKLYMLSDILIRVNAGTAGRNVQSKV